MNTSALLNKKTNLVQTTSVLRKEIKLSFLNDIRNQTKLLDQKKKLSEKRILSLRSIGESFKQQRRGDQITESVASGAGLLSLLGGGVGGVKGRPSVTGNKIVKFNRIKPSRLSGLRGRLNLRGIGKGNVVANTLLAGFDFASRKGSGQTNLQAIAGTGGGLAGGIAGAAIGQALIPIPVVGALIGGFVGSSLGSGIADRATGVNSASFRRKELEKQQNLRLDRRTEFTESLDNFDSALDKFGRYDDRTLRFILRSSGRDDSGNLINPIVPRGNGGVSQALINNAYVKGIQVGVSGLFLGIAIPLAVKASVPVIAGGVISLAKKIGLTALLKKFGLREIQRRVINFVRKKIQGRRKVELEDILKVEKRLQEQAEKEQLIEDILEAMQRVDSGVDFSTKGLSTKSKSLKFIDEVLRKSGVGSQIRQRLQKTNQGFDNMNRSGGVFDSGKKIQKKFGPKSNVNQNLSFNSSSNSTIAYNGTLNSIHAFNNLTV